MSDPSPDTPSVCPTCRSTQPAARHTGRWWRLTDGTVDDSRHGPCPDEWHACPAAGSSPPHRPSVAAAALVARELADRYRTDRGCVNESVEQIARSTGLSNGQVRDALGALHQLGWWVVDGKGNHLRPTIRRPGPVLLDALEHRGTTRDADPRASRDHPRCSTTSRDQHRGIPPQHRGISTPASRDHPRHPIPIYPQMTQVSLQVQARAATSPRRSTNDHHHPRSPTRNPPPAASSGSTGSPAASATTARSRSPSDAQRSPTPTTTTPTSTARR